MKNEEFIGSSTLTSYVLRLACSRLASRVSRPLLVLALLLALPAGAKTVTYLDANGDEKTVDATELTGNASEKNGTILNAGWYYCDTEIEYKTWIRIHDDVHLILCNGCRMTVNTEKNDHDGLCVENTDDEPGTLTIYGQTHNMYQTGTLIANGGTYAAAIGSGSSDGIQNGAITINGGQVHAYGGDYGAGIGTGKKGDVGSITINGGYVKAYGGKKGAAIGGGEYGAGGTIKITGGYVLAAGYVQDGHNNDDIGNGNDCDDAMSITITGGSVWSRRGRLGATPTDGKGHTVYNVNLYDMDETQPMVVAGLPGYGTKDLAVYSGVDGKTAKELQFWLPNGSYDFTVGGRRYTPTVNNAAVGDRGVVAPSTFTINTVSYTAGSGNGWYYSSSDCAVMITKAGYYTISGSDETGYASINVMATDVAIQLTNLTLSRGQRSGFPINFKGGKATLNLGGANYVYGNGTYAALYIPSGSSVTLSGNGELAGKGANSRGAHVNGGTLIMSGGTIRDYAVSGHGGGVYCDGGGSFTMSGGTICGCSATNGGGGAICSSDRTNTLAMSGGTISACSSRDGGAIYAHCPLTLAGGTISSCSASARGGAVYADGALTLNGGTIDSCSAANAGGGVYGTGALTMNGGTISGCSAGKFGGAIYNGGTLTVNGGTISTCTVTESNSGGGTLFNDGTASIYGGTFTGNSASKGYGGFCYNNNGKTVFIYGGYFSGNSAASCNLFHCYGWQTNGQLYGGLFASDPVTDSSSGAYICLVLQDGAKVASAGTSGSPLYVVGQNAAALSDGTLSGGAFPFDPTHAFYTGKGLTLARYRACTDLKSGTFRYQISEKTTGVTIDDVDLAHGEGTGWEFRDNGLTLTGRADAVSLVLSGTNAGSVALQQIRMAEKADLTLRAFAWKNTSDCDLLSVDARAKLTIDGTNTLYSTTGKAAIAVGEKGSLEVSGKNGGTLRGFGTCCRGVSCAGPVTWNGATLADYALRNDSDNNDTASGAGVYVRGSGSFTLASGAIRACHASRYGGGVGVLGSGTFAMTGGTVADNSSSQHGGGVAVGGEGRFEMSGGTLSGNAATGLGGAIAVGSNAKATVSGGFVTGNTAKGGGSVAAITKSGSCSFSGGVFTETSGTLFAKLDNPSGTIQVDGGVWDVEPNCRATNCNAVKMTWHAPDRWAVGADLKKDASVLDSGFVSSGDLPYNPALPCYTDEGMRCGDGVAVGEGTKKNTWKYTANTGHCHCNCGLADCPGTAEGHGNPIYWSPWGGSTNLPDRAGHWYLTNNVALAGAWTPPDSVYLCLNGRVVRNANGRIANLKNGNLLVTDCQDTGCLTSTKKSDKGGCLYVDQGATLTLARATLAGTANNGGAVYVAGGTFEMWSGAIANCTASADGGGVCVDSGTFKIAGGAITNCTAANGGGLAIRNAATVEMPGGSVADNTASGSGGGIYFAGAELTLTGGTIRGNVAKDGGGVGVFYSNISNAFNMTGGRIEGNTCHRWGGGVYILNNSKVKMCLRGGEIVGNHNDGSVSGDKCGVGGGICSSGPFEMTGGVISNNTATASGSTALYANCITGQTIQGGVIAGTITDENGRYLTISGGFFDPAPPAKSIVSGYSAQPLTYTRDPTWYVIAKTNSLTCVDTGATNGVTGGAFAFFPLRSPYTDCGFKLANGYMMRLAEDGTYAVAPAAHFHNVCCDDACIEHAEHGWSDIGEVPHLAGFWRLTNDVVVAETWHPTDLTLLCLNGHTLSGATGRAIAIDRGVRLWITDCTTNGVPGAVAGIETGDGGALEVYGHARISDLVATNATVTMAGGGADGVRALPGTVLAIAGGTVTNLTADGATVNVTDGGAAQVRARSGTALTVAGGVVTDVDATNATVKVAAGGAAQVRALPETVFVIAAGSVTNLTASGATVNVTGGTVTGFDGTNATVTIAGGTHTNVAFVACDATILGGVFSNLTQLPSTLSPLPSTLYPLPSTLIYGGLFDALATNDTLRLADGFAATNLVTRPGAARAEMTVVASNGTVCAEEGYLTAGTFAFNPDGDEYRAAGIEVPVGLTIGTQAGEPPLYTLLRSDTLILNGNFENGWALPAADGTNDLMTARINYWTVTASGATVFGKDFTDWSDLGVYSNHYAVCLAPEAAVHQAFNVPSNGMYALRMRVSGRTDAQLVLALDGGAASAKTIDASSLKFALVRFSAYLTAGTHRLSLANASTSSPVALDAITLVASDEGGDVASRLSRITNGSFEDGTPVPPEDGANALAVGSAAAVDWTVVSEGAGIYGRRAAGFSDIGVTDGDYGLYLGPDAAVCQTVQCSILEGLDIEIASTGRWYQVSFDCALKDSSSTSVSSVQILLNDTVFATAYPSADGTWTSTKTLVFMPAGTNELKIRNASDAGTVLVDNFICTGYVHAQREYLYNNRFTYGSALPGACAYDYVDPKGRVTFACWDCSGAVGAFERHCTDKTLAGAESGDHALFAEDGGVFSQTFTLVSEGDYRLSFAIAARASASDSAYWPTVVTRIDGEGYVGTNVASSATSYAICAHSFHLAAGTHTVTFAVTAPARQGLAMDKVHLRCPDEQVRRLDITGVWPNLRVIPYAASAELLVYGGDLAFTDAPDDEFALEDFGSDGADTDYFRLEPKPGAYTHPTVWCDEPITQNGGFTIAFAGCAGTNEGPIAACKVENLAANSSGSDTTTLLSLENADGGRAISFVTYGLGAGGQAIRSTNVLATVATTNLVAPGGLGTYILTVKDGEAAFYVNGSRLARPASATLPESFRFDGLRLGALPEEVEAKDLPSRRNPAFNLSDVRVYDRGLEASQAWTLSRAMTHESILVTAWDPVSQSAVVSEQLKVGGLYGKLAAYRPRRSGAKFLGWTLEGSTNEVTALTQIACATDHRIFANWSNLTYTVTYDFGGYPGMTNRTETLQAGDRYDPPRGFEIAGVPFRGWRSTVGSAVTAATAFPASGVYSDETVTADFDPVFAELKFDWNYAGGGTQTHPGIELGTRISACAPATNLVTRDGYAFAGWWSQPTGGEQMTDETLFLSATGETWYAHWLGHPYESVWSCPEGETTSYATVSRTGEPLVVPAEVPVSTQSNRLFYAWVLADGFDPTNEILVARYDYGAGEWVVASNVVTAVGGYRNLEARWWTACPFDLGGRKAVLSAERTYLYPGLAYGAWRALPRPECENAEFLSWTTNAAAGAKIDDETIVAYPLATTNLVAQWGVKSVCAFLDPNDGTSNVVMHVVGCGEPYGELPVPTRPGYALAGWHLGYAGGPEIRPETLVDATDDHTLYAVWTNACYAVRYKLGSAFVAGRDFTQYYQDPWPTLYAPTEAEIEAAFGENVTFLGWQFEATGERVRAGETALVVSPTNLVASVTGVTCTVYLNPNDGVLAEAKRTLLVPYGEKLGTLPEPLRDDCAFQGWQTADGQLVTSETVWTRKGQTELFAKWIGTVTYRMTYDFATAGTAPAVSNFVYLGAMPRPPAVVSPRADGGIFRGWWLGDVQVYDAEGRSLVGETCPYQFNGELTAHWIAGQDDFAGALALTNHADFVVWDLAGTDEPGEPDHDGEGVLRATHWYKFSGTNGANVKIAFTDLTDYPAAAALALYRGTSLEELVLVAQEVSYSDHTLAIETTLASNDTYYVAVAQDQECAALTGYELTATGTPGPTWTSAWTDPDDMPGETATARNEAALLRDGFSDAVAGRVSPTQAYQAFTQWAGVGSETDEISPDALVDLPNVVLAAAYNMYETPTGAVEIVEGVVTTNAAGAVAMRLTLKVTGELTTKYTVQSVPLLRAALGVTGSTSVDGPYGTDLFTCEVEASEGDTVRILVTPKPDEKGEIPSQFFFNGTAL